MAWRRRKLLVAALVVVAANTLALVAVTLAGNTSVAVFLPFLFLCMAGCSTANTNAIQLAIEPLGHIAGTASAAVVSAQLAFGALAGYIVAALYDGHTALSTTATIAIIGLIGLAASMIRLRSPRGGESVTRRRDKAATVSTSGA